MDIKNRFCPKCSTYMNIIEISNNMPISNNLQIENKKTGLYLTCKRCSFLRKTKEDNLVIPYYSMRKEKTRVMNMSRMIEDYKNDSRYARTKTMKCINKKCKKLNSEIVIVNHEYYSEAMYICTECDHYWGKY